VEAKHGSKSLAGDSSSRGHVNTAETEHLSASERSDEMNSVETTILLQSTLSHGAGSTSRE
jgi:hypothetical protein